MLAMTPSRIESAPRSGPTVRSSMNFSSIGRRPERSEMASSLASSTVKPPAMLALPPRIARLSTERK
jgi:hypothetical protein